MSTKKVLSEVRRLTGLAPKFESLSTVAGGADVVAKEYSGAPGPDDQGGEIKAGGGSKAAEVGGSKTGPGQLDKTKPEPTSKEPGEIKTGGGQKSPEVGGSKTGPGEVKNTKKVAAKTAPGELADGGGAKKAEAGGADGGEISHSDDGLRAQQEEAEYRELRSARMYELVQRLS